MLKLLLGKGDEVKLSPEIWECLTCLRCKEVCPANTSWVDFVRQARKEAKDKDVYFECKHGKMIQILQRMMSNPKLKQDRLAWAEGLKHAETGEYFYFTGCLPYFDNMFTYVSHTSIAQSTLKIMNHAGITPVLSNDERCCGYECLWNGDTETFNKLAKLNIETIVKSGAKKVVTSCAECFRTLKSDYAEEGFELPFEVIHTTTFVKELLDSGKMKLTKPLEAPITYHDPCRLGRYEGNYDEPREILKAIPGVQFQEMERIRAEALCCGVGNFSNCDANTKFLQHDRLKEAKRAGAELMITTCPKCRIHYSCYLDGKPIEEIEKLEIKDITEIIADAL
jgi:Fe-S oxidoreductase